MIHLIINQASHTHGINKEEGLVGMIHTGNPLFVIKDCMDGNKEAIYHVNLVYLLDDAFTKNNIKYLSIEQERYIAKFLQEGGEVNDKINKGTEDVDPYENMDNVMRQLDNFLGSYFGEDNGKYAR